MHTPRIQGPDIRIRLAGIFLTFALSFTGTFAQTIFTWDANGSGASQTNGSGQWLGTGQWWDGTTNVNWDSVNPTIAQFGIAGVPGTSADTVTITGQTVHVAGINFLGLSAGATTLPYTIASTSGGALSFADNAVINVAEGSSTGSYFITFNAPITGSNLTIQKSAGSNFGYVTFSGQTTLTGTLTIKGTSGGLWVRSTNAANFAGVSNVVVENGSAFAMSGGGTFGMAFSLAGLGGSSATYGAIRLDSSNTTISGPITLTADAGILSNGAIIGTVVSGVISGNYGFTRYAIISGGASTFTLTGANTYTGTTTLGRASGSFNGGITTLDFSAAAAPVEDILYHGVETAGSLSLQAGYNSATVLNLTGKAGTANSQRFGDVIVSGGFSGIGGLTAINLTSGTGGSMNLSVGNIIRTGTGLLAMRGPASGAISTTMADGFLGPWATYRDASGKTSWAQISGGVVTGGFTGDLVHVTGSPISAVPGYTSDSHLSISGSSSGDVTIASGTTTDLKTVSMTDTCDDRVLNLDSGTLRLGATSAGGGGIQLGADAQSLLITGGTLTSGGPATDMAGQIIVTNNSVKSAIQIDSSITNNGTGAVMLLFNGITGSKVVLGGNNTFTGGTTIASGAVELRSGNALGTSGTVSVLQNAELQLSGGITMNRNFTVTGNGENNTGALRNLSGDNTINGTVTVTSNTLITSDSGTLTFNNAANSFTPSATGYSLTFGGAGDIVVNGRINFTTQGVIKTGAGRLTLGGNNTAITSGSFTVNEGALRISHVNALGNPTSGATTVNTGGALELYFATDSTVAENITFNGTGLNNTGAIRNVSGNNTLSGILTTANASSSALNSITADAGTILTISGTVRNVATSGSSTRLVALGGAGTINVTGAITNGGVATAVTALTKIDSGTVNLSGTNTYTGVTTVSNGTLHLNFDATGAPAANILYNGVTLSGTVGTLALGGGTLRATGKADSVSSQAFGTLTSNSGFSVIAPSGTGSGSMNLTFGDVTRTAGGTLRFDLPASGSIRTTAGADNALLTSGGVAFSTVGANDWAATGVAASGSRAIVGLSTISNGYTASTASSLTGNADIAAGVTDTALAADTSVTSLRFHEAQATTITLDPASDLTTGGILITSNVGANTSAIRGGGLRSVGSSDLVIFQNNTAAPLIISSHLFAPITKAGAGTLILEYNSAYVAGDYAGDFRIQDGVLQLVKTTSASIAYGTYYSSNYILGSGGTSGKIILGGAGANAVSLWGGLRIQGSGTSNAVVGGNTAMAVFHHYVSTTSDFRNGFLGGSGTYEDNLSLILSQGTLQLGANNTFKGSTNIYRSTIEVTKLANRGQASSLGTGDFNATSHIIQMATLTTSALNATALATLRYIGDTDSVTDRPINVTNADTADSVVSVVAAIENMGKGTLKFTSAFTAGGSNTVDRVLRLGGTNTGENEIVSFADASATIASKLEKVGTGRWILTGDSTYSGSTTIQEGTLQLGHGGSAGMVGMGDIAIGTGATLATNRSDTFTIYNHISGAGSLVVNNAATGVTVIDNVGNTYAGGTRVNTGTLMVNNTYGTGSGTGTGGVIVEATGKVAGTGYITPGAGNAVVMRGTLSVGEEYFRAAALHIQTSGSGSFTVEGCGEVVLDLVSGAGRGMLSTPDDADMLVLGGSVVLSDGSILRVQNLNGLMDWAVGDAWQIIDWTTLGTTRTGTFGVVDLPELTGIYFWDTSELYTSGVIAIAVPEPGRVVLLGAAAIVLVLRRRRHQSHRLIS